MIEIETDSGAMFSDDRKYRWLLWRVWDVAKPATMFIGLNPSTADETEDDPTVRRCIDFARRWGSGSLIMANLFGWRSTDPSVLPRLSNPVGVDNWRIVQEAGKQAATAVAAWGTHGTLFANDLGFHHQWNARPELPRLQCLGVNADGTPKHPLYIAAATLPSDYPIRPPIMRRRK